MKYHYEYRLRCVDLRNGGVTKGPYKTYSDAKWEKKLGDKQVWWALGYREI